MENNTCLEKQPLCEEMLEKMNAYWRAANYLSSELTIANPCKERSNRFW